MTSRVIEHSRLFNQAVRSGSWDAFTATFTPDTVMRFDGVPTRRCEGRDAIASFYAASPPVSTMTVMSGESSGDTDVVRFIWDDGHGGGTQRVKWHDDQVADVTLTLQPQSATGGRTVR